jgi:hypothetical protein
MKLVQDRVRPAILFGFFWVAMRQRAVPGENGVSWKKRFFERRFEKIGS